MDTPQRQDDVRAALDVAKAREAAASEAYDLMVLGPRKEDIAAAKATLQAYEADLALARRELADAQLYAPTNGVIRNRLLETGDMASPQKPVFTLALDDPVWVRAYVPETDLGQDSDRHEGGSDHGQLSTEALPGLDWVHFAHRRVHSQVRRDARGAHQARL